jgi:cell division protein FtsW (lipid II flippase)
MATQALSRPRLAFTPDQVERLLLVLAALFLAVNTLALTLTAGRGEDWIHFLVWLITAWAGHLWLRRRLPHRDPLFYPLALFLSGWGMLMIERLAPIFADRQTIWLVIGVIAALMVASIPSLLLWLRNFRYTILLASLALLVATILFGVNPSGQAGAPQLWLGFGSVFFQPSELLKVMLVVFLASYLAEQYPALQTLRSRANRRFAGFSPRVIGPVLLMCGLSVTLLFWQRDLGTAALFFIVLLLMLYLASGFGWLLWGGTLLVGAAGIAAYRFIGLVRLRIDIWWNPWLDPDGSAFQIVQSLFAFAAGGAYGSGVGNGSPTFIPVVHSDFVFAALAEEWGLLGVIVVLGCIVTLVMRGLRVAARQSQRPFYSLMAAGLSLLIAVQTLLITGGVLKLIPLTGVTLPFLSYGGSSLLMTFVLVGLLIRLSAEEDGERDT